MADSNRVAQRRPERVGVVATPCQALALAKMQMKPLPENDQPDRSTEAGHRPILRMDPLLEKLTTLLKARTGLEEIIGMDIPPRKDQMAIYTKNGPMEIPWDEINP